MILPIYITENDARRLRTLLESHAPTNEADAASASRLAAELERAHVVPEAELPPDAITMNSTVELEDLADRERSTYTLVFPEHADIDQGRISVLAPLGMAMLGYRVGAEFEWPMPGGTIRVRVLRLVERTATLSPLEELLPQPVTP